MHLSHNYLKSCYVCAKVILINLLQFLYPSMISTAMGAVIHLEYLHPSYPSLSSEAYWLRENPSMKARLKPSSRITA